MENVLVIFFQDIICFSMDFIYSITVYYIWKNLQF